MTMPHARPVDAAVLQKSDSLGPLILTGELPRATSDFDVLYLDPDIGRLQEDIRAVADRLDLTPGWLNGSIQAYLDVLPPDYKARLNTLPARGKLHIAGGRNFHHRHSPSMR
jgi:hypothetical protein